MGALFYLEQRYTKDSAVELLRIVEALAICKPLALDYLRSLEHLTKAEKQALMVLQADEMIYVRSGVKLVTTALYALNEEQAEYWAWRELER